MSGYPQNYDNQNHSSQPPPYPAQQYPGGFEGQPQQPQQPHQGSYYGQAYPPQQPQQPQEPHQGSYYGQAYPPQQPGPGYYGQAGSSQAPQAYSIPIQTNYNNFPDSTQSPKYETTEDQLSGFDEKTVRLGFIRKVYSILTLQLLVTGGIIALFIYVGAINR